MTIEVGSLVKINPEIFGENPIEANIYGDIGYVGITRHLKFEVKSIIDEGRGLVAYCKVLNPNDLIGIEGIKEVVYEGECQLLVKDCILTNEKINLVYHIEEAPTKPNLKVDELMKQRHVWKKAGKSINSQELKDNWRAIQKARDEYTAALATDSVKVYIPYIGESFTITKKLLPDATPESIMKFKRLLVSKIRAFRKQRKTMKVEQKIMFYEYLNKIGGVYTEGGQPMRAYENSLGRILDEDKIPNETKNTYIGIEIEFIHTANVALLRELLIKQRLHKNVQLTEDGSVKPCHNQKGYMGSELRILAKTTEIDDVLGRLSLVFANPRVDAYVNRSCGLHVHLDCRKRNASLVYKNFVRLQKILRGSQPAGRITNHHCIENKYEDIRKAQEGLMKPKYLVVNPNPHHEGRGTIEIRVHDGTVNCFDILNWVNFLNVVADYNKEIKEKYKTTLELSEIIDIPLESITYIDARIEQFNSLSVG